MLNRNAFHATGRIERVDRVPVGCETEILQRRASCSPPALKGDEAWLVRIGAPEIQNAETVTFGILDSTPVQQMHSAEIVETGVGPAILVEKRIFVADRQHSSHRPLALECDADFQCAPEIFDQIAEPNSRLRRNAVSFASNGEQTIKRIQELLVRTLPIGEPLALSAQDFSLN